MPFNKMYAGLFARLSLGFIQGLSVFQALLCTQVIEREVMLFALIFYCEIQSGYKHVEPLVTKPSGSCLQHDFITGQHAPNTLGEVSLLKPSLTFCREPLLQPV